jgi:hypothetical protein
MKATRTRFESFIEWAVAAAFIVALAGVASVVVREFRTMNAVTPVSARETIPPSAPPAGIPSRAVSVPILLLSDGKEIRVGDSFRNVAARLGRQAEVGPAMVERAPIGERQTRSYDYAGSQFILVVEPFEAGGTPRVAAIYLQ